MLHRILALLILASLASSVPSIGAAAPVVDTCAASMADDAGCCGGNDAAACNDDACRMACGAGALGLSGSSIFAVSLISEVGTEFSVVTTVRAGVPPDPFPPKR